MIYHTSVWAKQMHSKSWIEEVGDKRKILGKENIKKAQAALEKREKEKNKPLELESDDDDETSVLTFKNKDKKRYKEIKSKMDLLIESQRQLREDFQKVLNTFHVPKEIPKLFLFYIDIYIY